jgi:hypothetical protein
MESQNPQARLSARDRPRHVNWEKYATQNAEFSILTQTEIDYRPSEGREFFFRSGDEDSRRSLERIHYLLPGRERCVDLGCGIGRLALPHVRSFPKSTP